MRDSSLGSLVADNGFLLCTVHRTSSTYVCTSSLVYTYVCNYARGCTEGSDKIVKLHVSAARGARTTDMGCRLLV